jgi:hypothetical protein
MTVDPAFDTSAPLSETRVTLHLRDGRTIAEAASGARGYPGRPATEEQLAAKFAGCARRTLSPSGAEAMWATLRNIAAIADVSAFADPMVEEYPSPGAHSH